jgi:hypothetical protein
MTIPSSRHPAANRSECCVYTSQLDTRTDGFVQMIYVHLYPRLYLRVESSQAIRCLHANLIPDAKLAE